MAETMETLRREGENMGYTDYLIELLRPLGIYDWDGGVFQKAELAAEGQALDGCGAELDRVQREMNLATARDEGLAAVEALLPYRPVASGPERRRAALAALLRIGGDSFTLDGVNDNLAGCGLNALAEETGQPGHIEVSFPEVPGIPVGFAEMKKIIEEIVPCHIGIEYVFWYITWAMMEARFATWGDLEAGGYDWESLETLVR